MAEVIEQPFSSLEEPAGIGAQSHHQGGRCGRLLDDHERVLGFVRDMVIAIFLGAGLGADAFFVAFRIPNLLRRLFAEGALSAALSHLR